MGSAYGPADLQSAYKVAGLSSPAPAGNWNGRTVAIVDAFDAPNAEADLGVYRAQYGLPSCTTANGCFRKVNQRGGSTPPAANVGWAGEISLDVDMVSAVCPDCHILLVEADSASVANLSTGVNEAVTLGASAVSNSYGAGEFSGETGFDAAYTHPGVPITASTGDGGYGTSYPAVVPGVVAVGGTSLWPASTARGWTESAWAGAGSGCSTFEPKPAWQHDLHCPRRMEADVSAVADPGTGVSVYDSNGGGGWGAFGGTSAAAPIVAAILAQSTQAVRAQTPASLYATSSSFFDVTQGTNANTIVPCDGSYFCVAGAGYDGPTGLGTPDSAPGVPPLNPTTSTPSAVAGLGSSKGYVGAFAVDRIGQLWERPYVQSLGGWQPWVDHGFPPETAAAAAPVTVATDSGYMGAFVTAKNGDLEELYYSNGAWLWNDHGLPPGTHAVGRPVILNGTDGVFSIGVRGTNGHLDEFHIVGFDWTDDGQPSSPLAGNPTAAPDYATGLADVFGVGANGQLQERTHRASGWVWVSTGAAPGGSLSGVSAVAKGSGSSNESVFAVSTHGHLLEYGHTPAGWKWIDHGLAPASTRALGAPSALVTPTATEVFVTDTRGHVDSFSSDGGWHWTDHGMVGGMRVRVSPTLVSAPSGYVAAFSVGLNSHLEENYLFNGSWLWTDHGQ